MISTVISKKVSSYRVFAVQKGEQVAIKPMIIPLAAAAGSTLFIIEEAVLTSSKIVLLPGVPAIPVIERRRYFISTVIAVPFRLMKSYSVQTSGKR